MMGIPTRVPRTPGLVMEKVAPWISSGFSLRLRALSARSTIRLAIPTRLELVSIPDYRDDETRVQIHRDPTFTFPR